MVRLHTCTDYTRLPCMQVGTAHLTYMHVPHTRCSCMHVLSSTFVSPTEFKQSNTDFAQHAAIQGVQNVPSYLNMNKSSYVTSNDNYTDPTSNTY